MAGRKSGKTHWLRNTLCVLIVCGIIGTVISAVVFSAKGEKSYASAQIQFSFDGAAQGQAPNGYPFDIKTIASDEVLERALAAAGMADRYTAEQLRGALEVRGVYPDNIVEQMTSFDSALDFSSSRVLAATEYHPTLYTVRLDNGFDARISRADQETLLRCVMEAYREYFSEVYSAGTNAVALSYNLEDYDYTQRLTILTRVMEESIAYAEEMYAKAPTLTLNGMGFNDIAVRLRNLISTDIAQLSANITMNTLTTNTSRLIIQYDYEIRSLNNQLARKKDQLARLDALIASYQKNEIIYLSTSESLTKIDGNSSETYDALVAARREVADEITEINTQIATYQLLLNDLIGGDEETEDTEGAAAATVGAGTTAATDETAEAADETAEAADGTADVSDSAGTETEAAEEVPARTQEEIDELARAAEEAAARQITLLEGNIDSLVQKREAVMTDFAALIKQYNDERINDMTVAVMNYRYEAPSLFSMAFIVHTVKYAGALCALGFIVCIILLIRSRAKESQV